jgi:hypothetical protein
MSLSIAVIAAALAACSSGSDAKEEGKQADRGAVGGTAAAAKPAPVLPIAHGIYIDEMQQRTCGEASRVFVYDGGEIGEIVSGISNSANGAFSSFDKITRIGAKGLDSEYAQYAGGYTIAWTGGQMEGFPTLAVKPGKAGDFTRLTTSGNTIISFDETPYKRCQFAQLSRALQSTIRAERASLASSVGTAALVSTATGKIAFPPLEKGYYAINMGCAQAVADGGDMIAYLDEKRFGSWDGFTQIQGFESLGANRYRVTDRSQDENGKWTSGSFVIVVKDRTSFVREEDGIRHTFCPANQIPASIKQDLG